MNYVGKMMGMGRKKKRASQQRDARWAMMRAMESRGCTKDEVLIAAAKMKRQQTKKAKPKDKKSRKSQWDRSQPYCLYLVSSWWKVKRMQKLRSTKFLCERCGGKAEQVHHKHYRTLNCEKNSDLESVCRACHEREHECRIQAEAHLRSINNPA